MSEAARSAGVDAVISGIVLIGAGLIGVLIPLLVIAAIIKTSLTRGRRRRDIAAMPEGDEPPVRDDDEAPDVDDNGVPANVRRPHIDERMVRVFSSQRGFEADLRRTVLLDAGIYAHADGGHTSAVLGGVGLAEVVLRVPERDADRARQVLAGVDEDEPATPEQCPACGYDLRATPERCPECGLAIA